MPNNHSIQRCNTCQHIYSQNSFVQCLSFLLLGEVSAACVSCFPFVFLRAPSIRWPAMVSVAGTQANVCTKKSRAPHNHSTTLFFLLVQSFLSINYVWKYCKFVHSVERPPQEALFVVRYTKLSTVHDFENRREGSFSTSAQSTAGQRGDGAEELMWRQALLPLCLTVAHHLLPIYLRVSDDKLAPLLVMGYCKMESRLDLSLSSRWKYNFKWSVCVDEDARRRVAVAK